MKELIIIAGANGSGKSTFAKQLIQETGFDFLNADEIEKNVKIINATASKLKSRQNIFSTIINLDSRR